jgi:DNA-binding NtrC family response regulator
VILCDADAIQPRHLNLSFRAAQGPGRPDAVETSAPAAAEESTNPLAAMNLSGTLNEAVKRVTAEVERLKVGQALKNAGGSKERAAETLQISYKSLLQKQREYGIPD